MNMMNPASLANLKGLHPAKGEPTKLKAWRKAQMVVDPEVGAKRPMRITDVPRLYPGIAVTTWHQWEQPVGHKDFARPNAVNMARLCGPEITNGAVTPTDFYEPIEAQSGG
jgi:hypothetical protein